jgi:rhamnosyltransferase
MNSLQEVEEVAGVDCDIPFGPDQTLGRPRVAVCLAAYNGMEYIADQLSSILRQEGVDVQIFVSVDSSDDGTESALKEWSQGEPRISLLPFGLRFGGAGPNFFRLLREVDLEGFDYLSLADQDDLWHPRKLLRAHCLMRASEAFAYSSNVMAFWPSGKTQLVSKAQRQRTSDFLFEASGPGCTYVLQAKLALQLQSMVRGADSTLSQVGYHDWLIYAFARTRGYRWIIDEWPSMQYRQHANNQIGVNSGWRSYVVRVKKMLSGHGFEQALLIANLVGAEPTKIVRRGLMGGRLGHLWLAFRATQCRRKRIDQLWFFILCLMFAFTGHARQGEV